MLVTLCRRVRSVAAVPLIALALITTTSTSANATLWFFGDNFENNPGATWWFENGPGVFTDTNGAAHSGTHYANITRVDQGWTSVDHTLVLPSGFPRSCHASAWFSGYGTPPVRIEIINPADWTYVAQATFSLPDAYQWQQNTLSWTNGPRNVVIRLVVLNTSGTPVIVKIDDVGANCTT